MKIYDVLKLTTIAAILLVSLSLGYYFVILLPNSNNSIDIIEATTKCHELYELKKSKYWEREGQSKVIYNPDLKTCLALNIYNDHDDERYYAMIIDMANDETLMSYNDFRKSYILKPYNCERAYISFDYLRSGKKIEENGCERFELFNKMFEHVRSYGFSVNG